MIPRALVKAPDHRSSTRPFSSEDTSEELKVSKDFSAANRTTLMRATSP